MVDTAERYRRFASHEASGSSPIYERLARAVADDPELLGLLDELPPPKRQPNLLLASARLVLGPVDEAAVFVDRVRAAWADVSATMTSRSTQTNEPARTAALLPFIAELDGRVALVEVGCSAGLCLYPDRYAISYGGGVPLVESPVEIAVEAHGPVPVPERVPDVVARIGIDLDPLDVTEPDDLAWLEACIWPEHELRRARLSAAVPLVAADPPRMIAGDLVESIDDALALVPPGATPVVFHSAVLSYLGRADRARFAREMRRDGVLWISNEAPGVVEGLTTTLEPPASAAAASYFLVGVGGTATAAISDPHGAWLRWAPS